MTNRLLARSWKINPLGYAIRRLIGEEIRRQDLLYRTVGDPNVGQSFYNSTGAGSDDFTSSQDELVKVTSTDTTEDYLNSKVSAGTSIKTVVLNPVGNEQLEIGIEVDSGNAFPGTPENWQLFYRDDEQLLYIYDATATTWVAIGTGAYVDPGTSQGQLLYWDAANSKWTFSDIDYLGWDATNRQLSIGNSLNPGVLRSLYVYQYFGAGAVAAGTIGTIDSGTCGTMTCVTGATGSWTHRDRASDTTLLELVATTSSILNAQNLANRYNWLSLQQVGGGTIVYNTPGSELFQTADYVDLLGAGYTKKYDRLWSGATRNRYCGGAANVAANAPPIPDGWGASFADNLPDTNYAALAMGEAIAGIPTSDPLLPNVTIVAQPAGGQVGWKGVAAASGTMTYVVYDSASGLGIDALGYSTANFCNWNTLVAIVPVLAPYNTLAGAGLNIAEWIVRRHF